MVDNQHRKISGYRDLSEEEIEFMNAVKETANKLGALVESMEANEALDQRWVAIAKTNLQTGFMALTRSIAQPGGF